MSLLTDWPPESSTQPRRHRWSTEDYLKADAAGYFGQQRTELIDGEVFDVASQNNPHVSAISNLTRLLVAAFDDSYWLTVQSTTRLPRGDVPDPDFAIRPGPASADNSVQPLPLLVIEVSDETLLFDQTTKASMYAANAIQDYWVVNIPRRQLEVYREPITDPSRRFGWRYKSLQAIHPGGVVMPLAKPDAQIEVARIFK